MAPARCQTRVLAVLSLAAFMASLDLFIVNVAFPDIGRDFHGAPLSNLSWVLNGYAIVFAALLVPMGRLADRYGRKRAFLLGVAVFTAASAACALSTSLWMLVMFRLLQAAGAAILTPTSLGLLLPVFPSHRRAGAVRIWSATAAVAAAVGPVFGGLLVSRSWRWIFLVNIPIGAIALVAAARFVPDSRDEEPTQVPDLVGAGLLALAIALLALGLVKVNDWSGGRTLLVLALAVLGMIGFWRRSLRHNSPVVEPTLLRVRTFVWSNLTAIGFGVAFAANLLIAILWMQNIWHYSPLETGLAIAPGPLMVPTFAVVAGKLASRIPIGGVAALGCLLFSAGALFVLLRIGPAPDYISEMLPGFIIGGVGVGLALPTILAAATANLPPQRFATGSAVVNMSRQIGSVLGISVLIALVGTPLSYPAAHSAFMHAWLAIALFAAIGAVTAIGITPRRETTDLSPAAVYS